MSNVLDRFLKYVTYDTQSDEGTGLTPSTPQQMQFIKVLAEELRRIGMTEVSISPYGYLSATLPANTSRTCPTVGFIAHVDTSPDFSGRGVCPRLIFNYDGRDITLNKMLSINMTVDEFPELRNYVGQDLVVADGTTLLGADDKAGVAEIVSAMEYLILNPDIEHGRIPTRR